MADKWWGGSMFYLMFLGIPTNLLLSIKNMGNILKEYFLIKTFKIMLIYVFVIICFKLIKLQK